MINLVDEYAFGDINSLAEGLGLLVMPIFTIATVSVTIYFVLGAFRYLSSGGEKEALESARNMIVHAIIGFILLMVMFLILQYLPGAIGLEGFKIIQE